MKPKVLATFIASMFAAPAFADSYDVLNVPGGSVAYGIAGVIVGQYSNTDTNGNEGYNYNSGAITDTLGPPGANTVAFGVNNIGQVVGSSAGSGFLYSGGSYTLLNVPGATGTTYAAGTNDAGQIAGVYSNVGAPGHGFLYSGGIYTPFDDPLATNGTQPSGINNAGQIVGSYFAGGTEHGFIDIGGVFTPIDVPGAGSTYAYGINNEGQIVGQYSANGFNHSFLYDTNLLVFTLLQDAPGAPSTVANGINDLGQIVGYVTGGNKCDFGSCSFVTTIADATSGGISATPIPSTFSLFATGLGMIGLLARRKKRIADALTRRV
jgi:hypothetical protein